MYGFKHRAIANLPIWSNNLKHHYFMVRFNSRNKTTKRKYYKLIEKEKLRLVESGIDYTKINAVCKYLVSLKQINADRLDEVLKHEPRQLCFDFGATSI